MIAYCIGDSFTLGGELPGTEDNITPSADAWPGQLSKLYGIDTINLGHGGCGNDRIIKRAIDITLEKSPDLVIIAWTTHGRLEIADKRGVFTYWGSRDIDYIESQDRRQMVKSLAVNECENFHKWCHRRWIRQVILLQSFFKENQQKYIMFQTSETTFLNRKYIVEGNQHVLLAKHVDTKFFAGWPLTGIAEILGDSPRLSHGHPTAEGHIKIAEFVYQHMKDIGLI